MGQEFRVELDVAECCGPELREEDAADLGALGEGVEGRADVGYEAGYHAELGFGVRWVEYGGRCVDEVGLHVWGSEGLGLGIGIGIGSGSWR